MLCCSCKRNEAVTQAKFALGRQTRAEGNSRSYEGPALSVPVCQRCFDCFHGQEPVSNRMGVVAVVIGFLGGIAGIALAAIHGGQAVDMTKNMWSHVASSGLLGWVIGGCFAAMVTILIWGSVGSIYMLPAAIAARIVTLPWWFGAIALHNRNRIIRKHPDFRRLSKEGFTEVFWSDPSGEIITTKTETVTHYTHY